MQLLEGSAINFSLWQAALSDASVREACMLLRFTIGDWPLGRLDGPPIRATTIVLCGSPGETGENGTFLAKAIWSIGTDEVEELIWRATHWSHESALVRALTEYLRTGDATMSQAIFTGKGPSPLFHSRGQTRFVMWWIRQALTELPDERGLGSFIRRVGLSLLFAALAFTAAKMLMLRELRVSAPMVILVLIAAYYRYAVLYMAWRSAQGSAVLQTDVCAGLGKIYTQPVEHRIQDLSADRTPTLLEYSADIAALGGRHVCDLSITTANMVHASQLRVRTGRHHRLSRPVAEHRKPDALSAQGNPHPRNAIRRRPAAWDGQYAAVPQESCRSTTRDGACRRRAYMSSGPLIAGGSIATSPPVPLLAPPATYDAVIDLMKTERAEACERYLRHPYSWADAFHAAFKITRRDGPTPEQQERCTSPPLPYRYPRHGQVRKAVITAAGAALVSIPPPPQSRRRCSRWSIATG